MIKYVLMDIEGTTTPIDFVHKVLFPYSRQHLQAFVETHAHEPAVKQAIESLACQDPIAQLISWIDADRKHPVLKSLQGMIWKDGYESGAFTSEIYPDVEPALKAWKKRGLKLGIYSSGSVQAQKLLFKFTDVGDLTPYFSDYFDTGVGAKQDASSYAAILRRIDIAGDAVLFLSDVAGELDAARENGIHTVQLVRPGTKATDRHATAVDFSAVERSI